MKQSRRHPTSPYLMRRLRSYEEARAEPAAPREDSVPDANSEHRARDGNFDRHSD